MRYVEAFKIDFLTLGQWIDCRKIAVFRTI